jgi:GT2 family glycosyltransferase
VNPKRVSVIIPSWNGSAYLRPCLDGLAGQGSANLEVIVVDNASTDDSADMVSRQFPQARLIVNPRNLGFAGGCNVGLREAAGDILILLNQDAVVQPGWLEALTSAFDDDRTGVAGAKILEPDGRTLSHAGGYLELPVAMGRHIGAGEVDSGQHDEAADVDYVTGASLAVRKDVLDRIGLLDERFYPAFYEDVDLCVRVRNAGRRVVYVPKAVVVHDEASSTRQHWPSRHYFHYRNRILFVLKHQRVAQIVQEFLPAEGRRVASLPLDELRAARAGLTEVLALWPMATEDLRAAGAGDEGLAALRASLLDLRRLVAERQGADPAFGDPRPMQQDSASTGVSSFAGGLPEAILDELDDLWEVQEQPFESSLPLLGPLIVLLRSTWNSVATKWYVRPLLRKQVQFNGAVVRAIRGAGDMQAHIWDEDALLAFLAGRCGELEERTAALEAKLRSLEQQAERRGGEGSE